jgi:alpha-ribazole phosphatase
MHLLRTGATGKATGLGKVFVGRLDLPLCEAGAAELEALAGTREYPYAERVFVSPLARCAQTAEIIYPGVPLERVEALNDMDIGRFTGKTLGELHADESFARWLENSRENPPPRGEWLNAFLERIAGGFTQLFARMMDEKLTDIAVITHSGVIMAALAAMGLPRRPVHEWACENGHGYTLLFTPQLWMQGGLVEVFREIPHDPAQEPDFEL